MLKTLRERLSIKNLRPLLILAVALSIGAVIVITKPKAKPVSAKEKSWPVQVQVAEPGRWAPMLTLYGRVESLWSSQLTAGLTADVQEVAILEGDDVKKGQLLIRLDDRDSKLLLAQREAELAEIKANIRSAEIRYRANSESLPREQDLLKLSQDEVDRLAGLVTKQLAAQSTLDKASQDAQRQAITVRAREQSLQEHEATLLQLQAKRDKAKALRDQAVLEVERSRINAPFDARIAKISVSPGKRVRNGDVLVQLYDTAAMVVRAQVPTRYLAQVRRAQQQGLALAVGGAIDGQPLRAKLLNMAGQADGGGGVAALFAIEEGALFEQGRFVSLDLTLPERPGLMALPPEAIYGADRIYRIDGQRRLRPVKVVRAGEVRVAENRSLILVQADSIEPGTQLVTTQLPNAIDGLLVKPASVTNEDVVSIAPANEQ